MTADVLQTYSLWRRVYKSLLGLYFEIQEHFAMIALKFFFLNTYDYGRLDSCVL
jgi:hypothetical protein